MRRAERRAAWMDPERLPRMIFFSTLALLAVAGGCFAALWITGNRIWMQVFFDYPGVVFFLGCNLIGLSLSYECWRQFAPTDVMRPAWLWIVAFGCSQLFGSMLGHLLGSPSYLNPLYVLHAGGHLIRAATLAGQLLSPISMLFLATGLLHVVRICRNNGVLIRLKTIDYLLLGIVTLYTFHFFRAVVFTPHPPGTVTIVRAISWMSDPLLCILLLQAILIRRAAVNMGRGLIARCWVAFTAAIFFTSLGDIGLWASSIGILSFGLQALSWYVWYPASACFAAAPAYQLQAMLHATEGSLTMIEEQVAVPAQGSEIRSA